MVLFMSRKILMVFCALFLSFGLMACNTQMKGSLTEITMNEFQQRLDNDETFIVLFSQTSCSFCKAYKENLKEFINSLRDLEFKILSIEYNPAYSHSGLSVYTIELKVLNNKKIPHKNYIEEFQKYSYVNFVEEIV